MLKFRRRIPVSLSFVKVEKHSFATTISRHGVLFGLFASLQTPYRHSSSTTPVNCGFVGYTSQRGQGALEFQRPAPCARRDFLSSWGERAAGGAVRLNA